MNQKYTEEEKQNYIEQYLSGKSAETISTDTDISRRTLYSWIKQNHEEQANGKNKITVRNFQILENKIKRLEGIIEILKTISCSPKDPLNIKLYALEELYGQYSVQMLCESLDISRGTFYNHLLRNKKDNTWYAKRREEFRIKIQQVYDDSNQVFGSAKIAAVMKSEGYRISVEIVRELMRDMGLISIRQDAKDLYDKERR